MNVLINGNIEAVSLIELVTVLDLYRDSSLFNVAIEADSSGGLYIYDAWEAASYYETVIHVITHRGAVRIYIDPVPKS